MPGTNKNDGKLNKSVENQDPQTDMEQTVAQAHVQAKKDDPDLQPDQRQTLMKVNWQE